MKPMCMTDANYLITAPSPRLEKSGEQEEPSPSFSRACTERSEREGDTEEGYLLNNTLFSSREWGLDSVRLSPGLIS